MIEWLAEKLLNRAIQTPYTHLDGYMLRWWLVPYSSTAEGEGCGPVSWRRPIAKMLQLFGIAVRIHLILRSDDARHMHNHPWWFVSLLLDGEYVEQQPVYIEGRYSGCSSKRFFAGSIIFRRASTIHRLHLFPGESVLTMFVTGPRGQAWGFCEDLRKPAQITAANEYLKK